MIVYYLNIKHIAVFKTKAYTPLFVDTNTILPGTIKLQDGFRVEISKNRVEISKNQVLQQHPVGQVSVQPLIENIEIVLKYSQHTVTQYLCIEMTLS